ncbi:hypothetical protein EVAR_99931_1 [Eumeta japonica]|uniref:Uncharacterized protein n=1 Tax=Eumeta variegata TaxID=151549 RepID=A0A4C1YX46_EUMVA|nr:hypothetical protein EVAR_99931_1 [Eumeta japonica]
MVNLIALLKKYCHYYYESDTEPCIVKVVEDAFTDQILTDPAQASFINFVAGIKKNNILPGVKLLLLIIMPKLYKALIEKDITLIYIHLKLLSGCYSIEELLEYRTPLLAMLGQTLDVLRWNILTFDWAGPATLQEAIALQNTIFNTYQDNIPDKDVNWLKQKLNNLQPMNMYYYKEVWKPPGNNFIEIVSGEKEMEKKDLILLLSKNEYLKPPLSDSRVENALDKVIEIANLHNTEEMEAVEPILLSLFSYIAERKQDYMLSVIWLSGREKSRFPPSLAPLGPAVSAPLRVDGRSRHVFHDRVNGRVSSLRRPRIASLRARRRGGALCDSFGTTVRVLAFSTMEDGSPCHLGAGGVPKTKVTHALIKDIATKALYDMGYECPEKDLDKFVRTATPASSRASSSTSTPATSQTSTSNSSRPHSPSKGNKRRAS